ncbi:MAG: transcriptional repressor [Muribaculaceae bacterium]|nr:transcriptional repressor [Muribaculaceae bacterium]
MNGDDKIKSGIISGFNAYLKKHRLRHTRERDAIVEAVASCTRRISVNDMHVQFEQSGFHISVATIYNTFGHLVKAGLLKRHIVNRESAVLYERVVDKLPRLRMVCGECGSVREVKDTELATLMLRRRFDKFQVSHYEMNVVGVCLKCQRRRNKLLREKNKKNKQ